MTTIFNKPAPASAGAQIKDIMDDKNRFPDMDLKFIGGRLYVDAATYNRMLETYNGMLEAYNRALDENRALRENDCFSTGPFYRQKPDTVHKMTIIKNSINHGNKI